MPPAPNRRKASLKGYANSLPEVVTAHILVDHCLKGQLGKNELYTNRKKCGERFRQFNKLQKKNADTYYELLKEARDIVKKTEEEKAEKERLEKEAAKKKKKKMKKQQAKEVALDTEATDPNYVPSDTESQEDDNEDSDKENEKDDRRQVHFSTPKSKPQASSEPEAPTTTNKHRKMLTTTPSNAIVSVADIEINAKDVDTAVPDSVVCYENVFITKGYYKLEQDDDGSRYRRRYYGIVVFAMTKEDAARVKLTFPSGDRKVRVESPNITGLFGSMMEEFALQLFQNSSEAEEAVGETLLSGVLKKDKIIDIVFPEDMLQNIVGRAIPVIKKDADHGICRACGYNVEATIVANAFEVAANKRNKIGQEDMSALIQNVRIGPPRRGGGLRGTSGGGRRAGGFSGGANYHDGGPSNYRDGASPAYRDGGPSNYRDSGYEDGGGNGGGGNGGGRRSYYTGNQQVPPYHVPSDQGYHGNYPAQYGSKY